MSFISTHMVNRKRDLYTCISSSKEIPENSLENSTLSQNRNKKGQKGQKVQSSARLQSCPASHLLISSPASPKASPINFPHSDSLDLRWAILAFYMWLNFTPVSKKTQQLNSIKGTSHLCVKYGKSPNFCPQLIWLCPGQRAQSSALLCTKCWHQQIP